MFTFLKHYFKLINDIICDFLTDIKSLRYQLILLAYAFNAVILYLIYLGKADYKLSAVAIALLTVVYGLYFQSKHHQAEAEAEANKEETEK